MVSKKLGRKYFGIERDKKYFKAASERVNKTKAIEDNYLDTIENNQIRSFEKGLLDLIKNEKPEILESIQKSGKIEEDTEKLLIEVITNYKKSNFEKK